MDQRFVSREQGRLLAELNDFLSIPSISTLPAHAGDCRRAAEWVQRHLIALGCTATLLDGEDGHPVVWGESPVVPGAPTLLIYGHYDVQPIDPVEEWISPAFTPTVRDGQLFARGAVDDKGQVFCLIKAYEAVLDGRKLPPVNVRFLIEGEEECGGHVIEELLRREPERAQADAILVCDMAYYAQGWPAVYTALRGICYAEIEVRTAQRDLHSGSYGGVAPNAIETLCRMLTDLKGRDGTIAMPALYDRVDPPTAAELDGWSSLPFDEKAYMHEEMTGRAILGVPGRSVFERTWALPTFEIHGIRGGFTGDGAKTVIPAVATAKVSMRLVPGLSYEFAREQLREACHRVAPDYADIDVRFVHGSDPVQVDVTHPAFGLLDRAFESVIGKHAVTVRAGGSIPVVSDLARSGAPVLLTGIGLPDDGLHSPNEKLDLQQLWDGIRVFGRFLELLGAGESRS
ncbi:MAG TPA: M20/M25/M40 family metallo-hydrolase [Gemmatimonadales bacterium]|jgi:acetylornithine deacetylase/succinyl-diaminopimelate desuccinylase-like protein